jgi:hypothetical protein
MRVVLIAIILLNFSFGYEIIDSYINNENEEVITILCDNAKELKVEKVESVLIFDKNETKEILYIYDTKAYKSLDDLTKEQCK